MFELNKAILVWICVGGAEQVGMVVIHEPFRKQHLKDGLRDLRVLICFHKQLLDPSKGLNALFMNTHFTKGFFFFFYPPFC